MIRLLLIAMCAAGVGSAAIDNDWPEVGKTCAEIRHPRPTDTSPVWQRTSACAIGFFRARPVHITVKSIVPGSGTALGPTFAADFNADRWQRRFVGTEVTSLRGFWLAEGRFRATRDKFGANNSARDRFALDFYANARDLPRMVYYGEGPNSSRSNLVNFRERDVTAGVDVFNPLASWFAVGGRLEGIFPDIQGVNDPGLKSITSVYSEATTPGLAHQPAMLHYEAFAEPRRLRGKFQFDYRVGVHIYQDNDTGHYTFRRFTVDGTHTFHPTGKADDVLTIHDRLSFTGASQGNAVPFYLEETLGGSDINGEASLRGFMDYRFRAHDLALIQVEYDHRLWGPLGLLGFYDTGQVANKVNEMSFGAMRHSAGFGFSIWAGDKIWFKASLGLGSGEGRHVFLGIPSF